MSQRHLTMPAVLGAPYTAPFRSLEEQDFLAAIFFRWFCRAGCICDAIQDEILVDRNCSVHGEGFVEKLYCDLGGEA